MHHIYNLFAHEFSHPSQSLRTYGIQGSFTFGLELALDSWSSAEYARALCFSLVRTLGMNMGDGILTNAEK